MSRTEDTGEEVRREIKALRNPSGEVEWAVTYMELRSRSPCPQFSRPDLSPDPRSLLPAADWTLSPGKATGRSHSACLKFNLSSSPKARCSPYYPSHSVGMIDLFPLPLSLPDLQIQSAHTVLVSLICTFLNSILSFSF